MLPNPVVSIVCTVFNKEPWLEQTIQSFLAQKTEFPFEILLIDDASTDASAVIMRHYQEQYPELIRTFYNAENQGISRTWVTICKETRGKYIARCDGDDFWLDSEKLQKQVNLLENHPTAKWSNTDFDLYNEKGEFVSAAGFKNGLIPLADTFEKMLATRGFTMASTWLVDRQLMLEVNEELDLTTSDDTFNLQMDLFQRTDLAYLPEATVAYVVNQGSDSRPKDFERIKRRFNALLETQKNYLDKYPGSDYRKMLDILLDRNNIYELELTKKSYGLVDVGLEKVTIYFDRNGEGFSEDRLQQSSLQVKERIPIRLPEGCQRIRVDLSEQPSFYSYVRLIAKQTNTEMIPSFKNAIVIGDIYAFPNPDPQIIYELPQEVYGHEFYLEYELLDTTNIQSNDYIGKILSQHLLDKTVQVEQLIREKTEFIQQIKYLQARDKQLEEMTHAYNSVIGSRRWIIPTKVINFFRRRK